MVPNELKKISEFIANLDKLDRSPVEILKLCVLMIEAFERKFIDLAL